MIFDKMRNLKKEFENQSVTPREVWIWVEPFRAKCPRWLDGLIQVAQNLAKQLDAQVAAIILGPALDNAVSNLSKPGVARIIKSENPTFGSYDGGLFCDILKRAIEEYRPLAFLTAATVLGREVTARLASQLSCWFIPRCTGIYPSGDGKVITSKVVFGGQMEQWTEFSPDRLIVGSVQMELLPVGIPSTVVKTPVIDLSIPPLTSQSNLISQAEMDEVSVEEAQVIVAGGLGVGDREGFQLVERLARALKGVVAGTQLAVDRGWISHSRQIGRSGLTVYPDLFVACGISGSVHFTSGMQNSGTIMAINIDPEAPIFRIADVKIIGDLHRVIPSLLLEIEGKKNREIEHL